MIWQPEVIFYNTIDKVESKTDSKAFVTIDRQGLLEASPAQTLFNSHTYKGSENSLKISRVYSTKFICKFDMGDYPFDIQRCEAIFVMKGNTGFFAELVPNQLQYVGPIDLTQYFVKDTFMVEIKFKIELKSHFLDY